MTMLLSAILAAQPAAAQSFQTDTLTASIVLMNRAEELHRESRMDQALDLYQDAVLAMDDEGVLPLVPLHRIATIHLAAGRKGQAAAAMDRLAARAEWLGYPEVQARALIEAAVLHQQVGARSVALERMRRLEPLLDSPFVGAETAARIRSRISPARTR